MMEEIWIGAFWILSFLGILCAGYCLMLWLLRDSGEPRSVVLLPLAGVRDARARLYGQYLRLRLLSGGRRCAIVALDTGLTAPQRREIERFCRSLQNVYFCSPAELEPLLRELQ